jgi:crotonobetainyl-CoA:carnitine CoA-transferase CaiB-like acyl-CoA transferase
VLLENFRPGTLERWGLGPDELRALHPELIYVRVSGYGQTGPYAQRPGFAAVCEAMGGLRHVTGYPDRPPVRPNLSLGDTLGGLHAALGALLALFHRQRGGAGQVVDVALYEAVFDMMESVLPEYDRAGIVRQREGTRLPGIVPSGIYPCADGEHVIIGGNGDSIFRRLMQTAGRPDLADDPRLAGNAGRAAHEAELDAAISAWTSTLPLAEVLTRLEAAQVPAGRIYDAQAIAEDPHYRARGMFEQVEVSGRPLALPAMAPRLESTPGHTDWAGPELGQHNAEVYGELLGLSGAEIDGLRTDGVV